MFCVRYIVYRNEAGMQKTAFILLDILELFFMQINFLALCISCLKLDLFKFIRNFRYWPQSRNSRSAKNSSDPSSINCIYYYTLWAKICKKVQFFLNRTAKYVLWFQGNLATTCTQILIAPLSHFSLLCNYYYYFEAFLTCFFR